MTAYDWLVVGAGLTGCTIAERLAAAGRTVLLVDRQPYVGGACHDRRDEAGVLVHSFGPHAFHTDLDHVRDYLSRFTGWRPYEHRVVAQVRGDLVVPVPYNLDTLRLLWPSASGAAELEAALLGEYGAGAQVSVLALRRSTRFRAFADHVVAALFEGYSRKQWGDAVAGLDPSVFGRVPVRLSRDDRYFVDRFQGVPADGYAAMMRRMVEGRPGLDVVLGREYEEAAREAPGARVVYTGRVDDFFGRRLGELPYRSLRFEFENRAGRRTVQPVAQVNYPTDPPAYTRSTEFRHMTGQETDSTTLCREFPVDAGVGREALYPVPGAASALLYGRYARLAAGEPAVVFAGRLGTYRYLNMDVAVAEALATAAAIVAAA